jgi:monoamine oxidase
MPSSHAYLLPCPTSPSLKTLLAANISHLSSGRYGDAKTIPARDVLLQGGFSALVEHLADNISNIAFNTSITSISQPEDPRGDGGGGGVVEVSIAAGEVFTAPHAIVTLPLGVLKAKKVTFAPALPDAKLAAIENMVGGGLLHWPVGPSFQFPLKPSPATADGDFYTQSATCQ